MRSLRLPRVSPVAYRRVTLVAAFMVGAIIVTGGAVRLSGSGLGCSTWPSCQPGSLTPVSAASYHSWVEFTNRLFTGAVSLSVIAAVLASPLRAPRRRDLLLLSWSLVLGVVLQAVLGGIVVYVHLNPLAVMSHFLLSMAVLGAAVVLHHRAGMPDEGVTRAAYGAPVVWLGRLLVFEAAVVLVAGTLVTGTGPHAGGPDARRFDFVLTDVARFHGSCVMVFLGTILLACFVVYRSGDLPRLQHDLAVLLGVVVAQAGIGYAQYFTGVPPVLVGIHLAGAAAVWSATLVFFLGLYERRVPEAAVRGARRPAVVVA